MQSSSLILKIWTVAICLGIATPLLAEPAPVYDADSMATPYGSNEADETVQPDVPPPPEQDGTFVPMQPQQQAQPQQPAPQQQQSSQQVQEQPVTEPPQQQAEAKAPAEQQPQQRVAWYQGYPQGYPPQGYQGRQGGGSSLRQRIKHVEDQLQNLQGGTDVSTRIETLQNEVTTLRSQVESLTKQAEEQQKNLAELTTRLAQGGATAAAAAPAKAVTPPRPATPAVADQKPIAQPNVAEEQQIYQTAYDLIKGKKYNEAVDALQNMLKKYPSGQFASNAHYWLGELYGVMGKADQALNEFNLVVKTYPDSPRISDAQLKVGIIYAAQSKWPDAKAAFKRVINHYPGTTSARLASEQLKQIKQAGH